MVEEETRGGSPAAPGRNPRRRSSENDGERLRKKTTNG